MLNEARSRGFEEWGSLCKLRGCTQEAGPRQNDPCPEEPWRSLQEMKRPLSSAAHVGGFPPLLATCRLRTSNRNVTQRGS